MRKLYICALVLAGAFLFVAPARAQFTTVTGNIDDPSGIPYAGGTISAQLVPGSSGPWRLSGQPYSGIVGSVTLDSTGSFSIRVGDNSLITPGGTQWVFTVRSAGATIQPPLGTGAQTFQTPPITITGATQNITANIDAVPVAALTNITVGSGTVTSITTSGPITGGPITTTGNLDCPTCVVNNLPNTGTAAMTLDMGLSLAFNPPQSSGCTPLAAGICYDNSAAQDLVITPNGSDRDYVAYINPFIGLPVSLNCAEWQSSGGGTVGALGDAGGPCLTSASTLTAAQLNTVNTGSLDCTAFGPSSTMGTALNACIAALPASGGIANANNFTSPAIIDVAVNVNKPVVIVTCGITITFNFGVTYSAQGASWQGCPDQATRIICNTANNFIFSSSDNSMTWIELTGAGAGCITTSMIQMNSATRPVLDRDFIQGIAVGGVTATTSTDVRITNTDFNMPSTVSAPAVTLAGGNGILDKVHITNVGPANSITQTAGDWTISNALIQSSGTAHIGIAASGGSLKMRGYSSVNGGTGFSALSAQGIFVDITGSTFSSISADTVFMGFNGSFFTQNIVGLNPVSGAGFAAIHLKGDTIGMSVINNKIGMIAGETPSGNNYGIWMDTSAGGHFIQNQISGNTFDGTNKPQDVGYFFDNTIGNTTILGNTIATNSCTDIQTRKCVLRVDGIGSTQFYSNNNTNTGTPYAIAGSVGDFITNQATIAFADLPTAGNGSSFFCPDCTPTTPTAASGPGAEILYFNSVKSGYPVNAAGGITGTSYLTTTNCASTASPAVCGSAAAGAVVDSLRCDW